MSNFDLSKNESPQFLTLRDRDSERVPYGLAWEFQKRLLLQRIDDQIPDTILFVEHTPVITRGRGLQSVGGNRPEIRAMPLGPLPSQTDYFEVERGGDLTWHGPGQLVIYPIVKLDGQSIYPRHDVLGYLRILEQIIGSWLEKQGLAVEYREGATGIWTRSRKIASIGIAVRKWVTYHGVGLNLCNSLEGFRSISPCGFSSEVMTTLAQESAALGSVVWTMALRERIEKEIACEFLGRSFSESVDVRRVDIHATIS